MKPRRVGLIGDFNESVMAHRAIPKALAMAGEAEGCAMEGVWLPTESIGLRDEKQFTRFDGLWCVPASPYKSMEGALWGIQFAREKGLPFLGTCGGFQHALIEHARNVLGIRDADHAETNPGGSSLVVAPLACSLVEKMGTIRLKKGSKIGEACGETITEGYHCRYGLNAEFQSRLASRDLEFTGWDDNGEVRAFELRGHPFFVGTLFQPERAALRGETPALIRAFVRAM